MQRFVKFKIYGNVTFNTFFSRCKYSAHIAKTYPEFDQCTILMKQINLFGHIFQIVILLLQSSTLCAYAFLVAVSLFQLY